MGSDDRAREHYRGLPKSAHRPPRRCTRTALHAAADRQTVRLGMLRVLTAIALVTQAPPLVGQLASNDRLAHAYVSALSGVMEEFAAESEVDILFRLYHSDVTYEHPRIGVGIGERAMLRQGVISFLGQTRNPVIEELDRTVGEGVIVLRLRLSFDTRSNDGWQPTERIQVTILEITDGLISRIIDYW